MAIVIGSAELRDFKCERDGEELLEVRVFDSFSIDKKTTTQL